MWIFSDITLSYFVAPHYNYVATISSGSISDVSIGISTAGSDNANIATAGHLYVQLWSYGTAIGAPLQAGDVSGRLRNANFTQDVIGQDHSYIAGSSAYLSALSVKLVTHVANYAAHSSCSPTYSALSMNSNSYVDGLLLAAGVPQDASNRYLIALEDDSGLIPYSASQGSQIVGCS